MACPFEITAMLQFLAVSRNLSFWHDTRTFYLEADLTRLMYHSRSEPASACALRQHRPQKPNRLPLLLPAAASLQNGLRGSQLSNSGSQHSPRCLPRCQGQGVSKPLPSYTNLEHSCERIRSIPLQQTSVREAASAVRDHVRTDP